DRGAARVIRKLLNHSNARVFKYEDDQGKFKPVTGKAINEYIGEVMGQHFSAKDIRTWAGTLVCACALAHQAEKSEGKIINAERKIKEAIKLTAEVLGNTPAVCRDAYVCPGILTSFKQGEWIRFDPESLHTLIACRGTKLHSAERALLRLLKKQAFANTEG